MRLEPLIDIDSTPLLQRQIEFLRSREGSEFLVLVNHGADQVDAFFAAHSNFGCKIIIIDDGGPRVSGVGEAVRHLNEAEFRIAVVTNQPVIACVEVTIEKLRRIHAKLETDLGAAGAFVDRIY